MTTRGKLSDQFSDPKERGISATNAFTSACALLALTKLNFNIVHYCAITVNQIVQSISLSVRIIVYWLFGLMFYCTKRKIAEKGSKLYL